MRSPGRIALRLAAAALVVVLGACSLLDSSSQDGASTNDRQLGWKRVKSDGTFRSIEAINSSEPPPHLTAAGVDDGKPLIGYVVGGTLTKIPFRSKGARGGGLQAMTDDGSNYTATAVTDPESGKPARMWHGYSDPPDPNVISPTTEDKPLQTTSGLRPAWLAPQSTSEDFGVIGVVREEDRWRVHGWLADVDVTQQDAGPPLYMRTTPSSERLLAGMTEGSLLAAGDLTDDVSGTAHSPQAWTLDVVYGSPESSRWRRHPLDPVPDGLTDIATWELGWQLAGHKDLAPVVYDFDDNDGETVDVPSTRLDPDHPGVFLVLNVDAPPILATQSVDGSKVWFKDDGRWHHIAAPAGRLQGVELAGDELYLLIDGSIWHIEAPTELLKNVGTED